MLMTREVAYILRKFLVSPDHVTDKERLEVQKFLDRFDRKIEQDKLSREPKIYKYNKEFDSPDDLDIHPQW